MRLIILFGQFFFMGGCSYFQINFTKFRKYGTMVLWRGEQCAEGS